MKLYYSNTSPYSRKVRLVMIEKELMDQIEQVIVNPFENNPELKRVNPLGKIPALIVNNGDSIFDSPVICHFLDDLSSNKKALVPYDLKWPILKWEALADGMMDATYNLVMEIRRPVHEQSVSWMEKWSEDIYSVLAYMEDRINLLDDDVTLTHLSLGASIGYLELRLPNILHDSPNQQVEVYPKILAWYKKFKTRASMVHTEPHD